jgi:Zn-dependent peptidase ImmA (M78 family)
MANRKFLRREDIDNKVEQVISHFDPTWLVRTRSPIYNVVDAIKAQYGVPFLFDQDLGHTTESRKILGCFLFKSREIYVDRTLVADSPRFRFTLAHEVGHLILHRNIRPDSITRERKKIVDTRQQLRLGRGVQRSELDWIEWQANQFASALLLPRPILQRTLISVQQECDITSRLGTIYVDAQAINIHNYYRTLHMLIDRLPVSRTVLIIRLKTLGLLIDDSPLARAHIGKIMQGLFTTE